MSLVDAFAPIDVINHNQILYNTWGHLAPEFNRKYFGYIIKAKGDYGNEIIMKAEFDGLSDSPWFFNSLSEFTFKDNCETGLYRWDGWYIHYQNGNFCFGGGKWQKIW